MTISSPLRMSQFSSVRRVATTTMIFAIPFYIFLIAISWYTTYRGNVSRPNRSYARVRRPRSPSRHGEPRMEREHPKGNVAHGGATEKMFHFGRILEIRLLQL